MTTSRPGIKADVYLFTKSPHSWYFQAKMKGIVAVVAVLVVCSTLSEAKPAKRDAALDALVRSLDAYVQKRDEGAEKPTKEPEVKADGLKVEDVMHRIKVLEDRLFLDQVITATTLYKPVCKSMMHWLHNHLRAMGLAEQNKPDETKANTPKENLKRLLKRVLVQFSRDLPTAETPSNATQAAEAGTTPGAGGQSTTEADEGFSPTTAPRAASFTVEDDLLDSGSEENGSDEGGKGGKGKGKGKDKPSSAETDVVVMEEEDEINWVPLMASCWMYTLSTDGTAPDFPTYLQTLYF